MIPGQLVHLTPDRMRLKIPHIHHDPGYGRFLQAQLQAQAGITRVSLNPAAQSITIQFQPPIISVTDLLTLLHQIGDLAIRGEGNQAWTNLMRAFALEPDQVSDKAQDIGSFVIGGQVGDIVGGMAGAAVAGATLGPGGVVLGTQVGTFVGGVVGARLGLEALQTLKQNGFSLDTMLTPETEAQVTQSLEIRTSGKAGEVAGEVTGGLVGGTLFGPAGEIVGQLMGNMVGGQIAEDTARQVVTPPEKTEPTPSPPPSLNIVLEWWLKTSRSFVGETALATLGGVLMRVILGPQAEPLGLTAGTRAGRLIDWNPDPPATQDQAKTEEL